MNFNKTDFFSSYGTPSQLPASSQKEVVFSGRSNVGKSSLINAVFSRKSLARVSSTPGKTVTINFFKCEDVFFVDLPGYGYAKRSQSEKSRWAQLMEEYFQSGRNISLVLQLLDMRHKPTADDITMLNFLKSTGIPYIIVMTKVDKLNKSEAEKRRVEIKNELKNYSPLQIIEFSALNGTGTDTVRSAITEFC
ncbi:MAG: ribosome biogenesis GTP-binding protein YihA/YsxC [Clostridiales bacterium]|nr:ribosome biogenesis GTP-binding protein YihA/YsxC [Clostridiales bacterium]